MSGDVRNGMALDVCIVATRRPDLLRRTLRSFDAGVFANFRIERIIANIDPAFGSVADEAACIEIIKGYDADARITTPETAGFAAAVARVWAQTTTDIVLHLEEDWLLHKAVNFPDIRILLDEPTVAQVSFNHANKNWDHRRKGPYCYARAPVRVLGFEMPFKRRVPQFLTGPSFFKGSFLRRCAGLLNPNFDPEKQFACGVTPDLERYVADFKNLIVGVSPDYHIEDIGRAWREERGIRKQLVGWQSIWLDPVPAHPTGRPQGAPVVANSDRETNIEPHDPT